MSFKLLHLISRRGFSNTALQNERICIVGAGPAGFYAAQLLLKQLENCRVDIVEKLPVPFGLVRFGVAPDHPEVKNVINTFTKTAENPRFRFFGNVSLGKDISLNELRDRYHAVLLTYGADQDRELEVQNEQQEHVISARKFVAWYNGLPGAENLQPDLSGHDVTIVGQGNVAVDVARMLLSPIDRLKVTDTTEYALEALSRSQVERVHLVGRRGPLQAAFTIKELREMLKLPNVKTQWRVRDFEGIGPQLDKLARPRKRLTELMLKSLEEQTSSSSAGKIKQFLPIFLRAPKLIDKSEMEFSVTELQENSAVATKATERLPADLILRSIGYKSSQADNDINFDDRRGHVKNLDGRVLKNDGTKSVDAGLYVAGWLGTGPTGVILTTMNGAFAVAKNISEDIKNQTLDTKSSKPGLQLDKLPQAVTWKQWQLIDSHEQKMGLAKGKPREKIVDISEMLKVYKVKKFFLSSKFAVMNDIITPEPHLIPGYTGHCTQNRDRVGRTYGKQTHKLLIDPCIYHAPELIVPPIHAKQGLKDFPTKNELKILHDREHLVDAAYKHPIIPGYAGFVPNMKNQTGKRYVAAASAGVAQHETLMELYRCERRTLRHRDLLESGKGLFEHKLNERVLPQTNYRAPLLPVSGRSKGMPQESCPPTTEKLRYSKFTSPHFLDDDDEDKFIINSYAAHIPMTATRFGESNKVLTHNALCNFSDYMYKRRRDQWCCGQDLSGPTVNCPPVGHFLIYHKDSGMVISYAGHVPGNMYKFGRTYGKTTFDAKRWLCLHKDLDVLPEVASLDYDY